MSDLNDLQDNPSANKKSSVCLCILFNHPFPAVIPVLRQLYSNRFSNIRFIIPFYRSDEADVITVYRGSYNHSAYITDALHRLKDLIVDHFIFMHDDVLLNPGINQDNYLDTFPLKLGEVFIPSVSAVDPNLLSWGWFFGYAIHATFPKSILMGTGVEKENMARYMPSGSKILDNARKLGVEPIHHVNLRSNPTGDVLSSPTNIFLFGQSQRLPPGTNLTDLDNRSAIAIEQMQSAMYSGVDIMENNEPKTVADYSTALPFPVVTSGFYTDFYIIPSEILDEYAHFCGIAGACNLFVEIATPSILLHCATEVKTSKDFSLNFSGFHGNSDLINFRDKQFVAIHQFKLSPYRNQKEIDKFLQLVMRDVELPVLGVQHLSILKTAFNRDSSAIGWHPIEDWGCWSRSEKSYVCFDVPDEFNGSDLLIKINNIPSLADDECVGVIKILGRPIERYVFYVNDSDAPLLYFIDKRDIIKLRDIVIEFTTLRMFSPSKIDKKMVDSRVLGLGVLDIILSK